jgi:hypothetical protein
LATAVTANFAHTNLPGVPGEQILGFHHQIGRCPAANKASPTGTSSTPPTLTDSAARMKQMIAAITNASEIFNDSP